MIRSKHLTAGVVATLAVLGFGCGEQDLYDPPASPYHVAGRVALPTEAADVAILGNYAYLAAGQGGLQVVDITDPGHPQRIFALDTERSANAIAVARTYDDDGTVRDLAFLVDETEGIKPFDISFVPDSLVDLEQGTSAYFGNAICVAPPEYVGDPYELYLGDGWRAVTGFVSNPANPGFLDQRERVVPFGYIEDLAMSEDNTHIYVADDEMGVTVFDASRIYEREISRIGNVDTPGNAYGIDVEGNYVYVADNDHGLQVMEIGADRIPVPVAALLLPGDCVAIEVRDGLAFIAAEDAGLFVVDVRDPRNPLSLGNVPTEDAIGVAVASNNIVCIADAEEGLVVFRGPDTGTDTTPPAAVSDLSTHLLSTSALELSWTAPGDDGTEGRASAYELRWAETPIVDSTWADAQEIVRRPVPGPAGTHEATTVEGLTPGEQYYFALRTEDDAGWTSALSNLAPARMTAPTLTSGQVDPETGTPTTIFTFAVVYTDAEGDAPVLHEVEIDGARYTMTPIGEAPNYAAGVAYTYATTLGSGVHDFKFVFDDGHGPIVTTEGYTGPDVLKGPFEFEMIPVAVGGGVTFEMGSPESELGRDDDERQHTVTLTRDFEISEIEVTQSLYTTIMGRNPSYFSGSSRPVEQVTWYDAIAFCNALSEYEELDPAYELSGEILDADGHITAAVVSWDPEANGYRLPTESEWEYACRALTTTSIFAGELAFEGCAADTVSDILDPVGWYCGNSDLGTGPRSRSVAQKLANPFGLYDVHGNVWEWCWDRYGTYPEGAVTDPTGPASDLWQQCVRRGGSWFYFARDCRSASRDPYWPGSQDNTTGFRLARNAAP